MGNASENYTGLEIAVIGLSGRFPGANDVNALWELLKSGREGLAVFSDEELKAAGVDEEMLRHPNYMRSRGVIEKVEYFDNSFFGFSAREATLLDPQVRIFLECTYEALEDAGYNPFTYAKKIGLFAGANPNLYWSLGTYLSGVEDMGDFANKDLLSTRISYKLNLRGPSHTLFTACSTSMVAVHHACRSLLGGECDMALAGGVSIQLPQTNGYIHQEGMILSTDGHNRSFDEGASGTVFSNGAGIVLLKPLEDAINDGDHIYAVIKGTAVNNDGNRKVGFPAPSVKGQAEVIREALQVAQVEPASISYVEAHGSATPIGDPIEVEALTQAFAVSEKKLCGIGSVKSNLGHVNIASGVAGLIKAVLSLHHRTLVPSINFEKPNPKIDFDNTPFYVVRELKKWESSAPLRAGVSSFGVGGTNAHAVLEEAPEAIVQEDVKRPVLLLVSGHTPASLEQNRQLLVKFLQTADVSLRDAAYTLQVGRNAFAHRQALVCNDKNELANEPATNTIDENIENKIVFMFPGQGSQYINMGLELYKNVPYFKEEVDKGLRIANRFYDVNLFDIWFAAEENAQLIDDTRYTQPLLFVFEYALCRLMMKLGVQPDAMIGHSLGEFVAACIAGVFSYEDAIKLVIRRGKLIASLPAGSMMAVSINEAALLPLLPENISIAVINNSKSCVVSGTAADIEQFKLSLDALGYHCRVLRISYGSHSALMEPVLEEFREACAAVKMQEPSMPFISNRTGRFAGKEVRTAEYWVRHLREAVRFNDGIKELSAFNNCIFIEVGPGNSLFTLANQSLTERRDCSVVNLVRHPKEECGDESYFLGKLGNLWLKGVNINWQEYYQGEARRRVSLPTYAFDRKPFWFDEESFRKRTALLKNGSVVAAANTNLYAPGWVSQPLLDDAKDKIAAQCVVFTETALPPALQERYLLPIITVADVAAFEKAIAAKPVNVYQCSSPGLYAELRKLAQQYNVNFKRVDIETTNTKRIVAELSDTSGGVVWLKGNDRLVRKLDIPVMPSKPANIPANKNVVMIGDGELAGYFVERNNNVYTIDPRQVISLPGAAAALSPAIENKNEAGPELMQMLQQFSTALICSYFNECGVVIQKGNTFTDADVRRQLGILPSFNKFYQYFLHVLAEDGIIEQSNGQVKVVDTIDAAGIISNVHEHIVRHYPGSVSLFNLITHCVAHYRKALSGEIPAISVLFPDGSSKLLDSVSKDSTVFPGTSIYAQKAKELVLSYVRQHKAGKKIRILEVGAGRGELTHVIAPALRNENVEYFYTDIGKTFINEARKNFGPQYDFMDFKLFDIYGDPASQGFEQHSFDMVLALDVVHATPSLHRSIDNLRKMAVPGGWMLFIENTSSLRLVNLVWGLADGWWNFEDDAIRTVTPLMNGEAWKSLLAAMDFSFATTLPVQESSIFKDHELIMIQTKTAAGVITKPIHEALPLIRQKCGTIDSIICNAEHAVEELQDYAEKVVVLSTVEQEINLPASWLNIRLAHLSDPELRLPRHTFYSTLDQCLSYDGELIISKINPYEINKTAAVEGQAQDATVETGASDTELRICRIWNEVFGISNTTRTDNYFELGGDSLMMVAVLAKIEKEFRVKVKINEFHNNITVAALAKLIDSKQQDEQLVITKAAEKEFYPCTSAQKTMFYLQQLHPGNTAYNITKVIELYQDVDEEKLVNSINRIIEKQENLRTIFRIVSGEPSQKILDRFELQADSLHVSASNIIPAVEAFIRPFDLTTAPAIRIGFIKAPGTRYLVIDIHHIVCDGIAIDVLKKELSNIYHGGEPTELPVQYKDFSEWQNTDAFKKYLEAQKSFWLEKFKTPAPRLNIPADFVRNRFDTPKGDHFVETLQPELSASIRKLVKSTNSTLFSHLLSAAYIVLSKYSNVEDVVIGTGTSGRNFQNLDYIIGNFVNTVALRSFPAKERSYLQFQEEVKQTISAALENQDYQYDELINQLPYNQGKEDKDLFSVAVTLVTDSLVEQDEDPAKRLFKSYVEYFDKTSKFDLDINAVEKGNDVTIVIEYSSLLYKPGTIRAFYKHYVQVLEQVAANPAILLQDIKLQLPQQKPGTQSIKPVSFKSEKLKASIRENFLNHKY